MTSVSLPLGDAGSLREQARRTRFVRLALAIALAGAAVTVVLLSRGPRLSAGAYVPPGSNTIVVLDVSQSVEANKLQLAYSTLSYLGHSKAHVGLVVTSGYAYEALPPGSAANALLPIADLFRSRGIALVFGRPTVVLPPNPWRAAFSAGTELSSGLQLARTIVESEHLQHPSVVLISDLFDDSSDLPRVTAEGKAYQRAGIPLRIVGLDPTLGDLQFFLKAAGKQGSLLQPTAPKQAALQLRTRFPTTLVVLAALVAVLLAIDELLFAPLRWGVSKLATEQPS
jgi:hypothetical protein